MNGEKGKGGDRGGLMGMRWKKREVREGEGEEK